MVMEFERDDKPVRDAVKTLLSFYGEDVEREGLKETPRRVSEAYRELFSGLNTDPSVHLEKTFTSPSNAMVTVSDIKFVSVCEHHLLPFNGICHIGYIPSREWENNDIYKIVGLSKLPRVVEGYASRPQVQENLTFEIAQAIQDKLKPEGVIVVMSARHSCMEIRGVKSSGSLTTTSSVRGVFDSNTDGVKDEFFKLLQIAKS